MRWTRCEGAFFGDGVGGSYEPGKANGATEGNDGEDNKGQRANAANITKRIGRSFLCCFGMVAEVDLTDPGGRVEEEREPAYPGPELHPTDGLNAVGKIERRLENIRQQLYRAPPSVSISRSMRSA